MNINIIAAIGKNNELGKNNDLIWHIKEDLQYAHMHYSDHNDKSVSYKFLTKNRTGSSFMEPLHDLAYFCRHHSSYRFHPYLHR